MNLCKAGLHEMTYENTRKQRVKDGVKIGLPCLACQNAANLHTRNFDRIKLERIIEEEKRANHILKIKWE